VLGLQASCWLYGGEPKVWISFPTEASEAPVSFSSVIQQGSTRIGQVPESQLPALSQWMHKTHHRCGGFFYEHSKEEALEELMSPTPVAPFPYVFQENQALPALLSEVQEGEIRTTISTMAAFQNRLFSSPSGVASQKWVQETWKGMAASRPDISVSLISHKSYAQPSVMVTIQGQETPESIFVLGGHGDSILSSSQSPDIRAPGADDNASGIATITEVLRIIVAKNIHFRKTVMLFSYAAEEIGLRGSQDIAKSFQQGKRKVEGVMQLDMTNYAGSPYEIVFMTDFVDANLTAYLGKALTTYMPEVRWTTDRCGYACSDHASWHRYGYSASMPFEARMNEDNPRIHTTRDTLDVSRGTATHAVNFGKLALAYLVGLAG